MLLFVYHTKHATVAFRDGAIGPCATAMIWIRLRCVGLQHGSLNPKPVDVSLGQHLTSVGAEDEDQRPSTCIGWCPASLLGLYDVASRPVHKPETDEIEPHLSTPDPRRRRLLFRAWHRGTREMDLVMGRFTQANLVAFTDAEVTELEALMEANDRDVFDWVSGMAAVPGNYDTPLFRRLRAFHLKAAPAI